MYWKFGIGGMKIGVPADDGIPLINNYFTNFKREGKMRFKIYVFIFIIAGIALSLSPAQAYVYKTYFNVYTSYDASSNSSYITFDIELADSNGLRPPDAVKFPLIVTAPNGQTFQITANYWEEWDIGFFYSLSATNFTNSTIPAGTYKLTYTDKSNAVRTATRPLASPVSFLPASVITYPTAGITLSSDMPTFTWSSVAGAAYYRIRLRDLTWGEPVFWYPANKDIYMTQFVVPLGLLVSGHSYQMQIEARDSDKGLSKRSRSAWVQFTAP